MHMQPFEIIANGLAIVILAILVAINFYGRRRFEPADDKGERSERH